MRFPIFLLTLFAVFLTSLHILAADGKLLHVVPFTDYGNNSINTWLLGKGFKFEEDTKQRNRIDLNVDFRGLVLEAKSRAFGIMVNESINVPEFTHVEIDWGVNKHPAGASYEQGIRNEAIMVTVFMGDERQPSGSLFIPDSPYFVGLFLCFGDDRTNHPYVGTYFKKSGRFVCTQQHESHHGQRCWGSAGRDS